MSSPLQAYQARLDCQDVSYDERQQAALQSLERVYQALMSAERNGQSAVIKPIKGTYLWGDVGRGKTFLMDLFYAGLPEGMGLRLHFHHFMARLHRELNLAFGQKNPLQGIAKRLASECRVLCFDEFFVSDIGDAMLLGGLVEALFDEGVVLVATSNIAVEDLFQNQLQKARFAPAIAVLKAHLEVIHLAGDADHRLRHRGFSPIYFVREQATNELTMAEWFAHYASDQVSTRPLLVCGRSIPVRQVADNLAWFDFSVLCQGPRSSLDYMALAQDYPVIMVSNIPELSSEPFEHIKARGTEDGAVGSGKTGERAVVLSVNDDAVRRFISLVDECYDHQVVLLLEAHVDLENLYTNGALLFEFRRTYSRLIEMKSHYYQALRAKQSLLNATTPT